MTTYVLSIVAEGKDNASGVLGRLHSALGGIGSVAGGILTAGLFTKLASGVAEFARQSIDATRNMQAFEMGLSTLVARELRMTDETMSLNAALDAAAPLARILSDELRNIAIQSPYELGTIQDTFRLGMAFGFTADQSTKLTKGILNMAAGVGANNEMLGRMAYNFAQIRLQGKVTALDIRQLAMAGFDLEGALRGIGEQFGITIKDHNDFNKAIASGKLTWEDFVKGFEKYSDENFGGAAQRMSRTLTGLGSTFKDVFMLTMPKVLGPAAERVTGWLQKILDQLLRFSDSGALDLLGQSVDRFLAGFEGLSNINLDGIFKLFGMNPAALDSMQGMGLTAEQGQQFVDMNLTPRFTMPKLDIAAIIQNAGFGWEAITQAFEDQMESIDWQAVSDKITEGIDSIDWASAGNSLILGVMNLVEGIWAVLSGIDWLSLFDSITLGVADFIAGMFGSSYEQVRAQADIFWAELGTTVQTKIDEFKNSAVVKFLAFVAAVGAAISLLPFVVVTALANMVISAALKMDEFRANAVGKFTYAVFAIGAVIATLPTIVKSGFSGVVAVLLSMGPLIENELRKIAKIFFNRAQGWMQQLISAIRGMISSVVAEVSKLIDAVIASIRPIIIPISWGNPGKPPNFGGGSSSGSSGSGGGGSGTCFAGDTQILMADSSLKPIKDIAVGDVVLSWDLKQSELVTANVTDLLTHRIDEIEGYLLVNGYLRVTTDHLLYVMDDGWKGAGGLSVGDLLLGVGGVTVPVRTIEELVPNEPVYNFHTDRETHNYFAGGVLAHNTQKFASGGISRGPTSGYFAMLHGDEAVIPLSGGSVPVRLNTDTRGGGNVNHFNFQINGSGDPQVIAREIYRILKAQGFTA